MRTKTLTFIFTLISLHVFAQRIEYTFTTPGDTTKNYYVTVFPADKIKGAKLYDPANNAREAETRKDLKKLWKEKYGY